MTLAWYDYLVPIGENPVPIPSSDLEVYAKPNFFSRSVGGGPNTLSGTLPM